MLPSGLPEHVADEEVIARHIFDRKQVRRDEKRGEVPKRQAFMPKTGEYALSVTRIELLRDQAAIERNGVAVGKEGDPPRVLYCYTRLTAADIRSVMCKDREGKKLGQMDVVADEPPHHHAHIIKFPELIEGEKPKLLQMDCAEDLADRAAPITSRSLPYEDWEVL